MKQIWNIFRADWKRLTASVVAVVVMLGLCLVPCLYAWFNILSNWDPYGTASTSRIKVAVASEDDGCDVLGLHVNIGELVLRGLESNDLGLCGWCPDGAGRRERRRLLRRADPAAGIHRRLRQHSGGRPAPSPDTVLRKREKERHRTQDHQQGQDRRAGADQHHHFGKGGRRPDHRRFRVQGHGSGRPRHCRRPAGEAVRRPAGHG